MGDLAAPTMLVMGARRAAGRLTRRPSAHHLSDSFSSL
jgi:hypothetical protein